jgi:hypothetical protein
MCCDERDGAAPAPLVAAMLSEYRTLSAERRHDWGGENESVARGQAYARWLGPRILAAVFGGQDGDWPAAVRDCLVDPLPTGPIVAPLGADGVELRAGPTPTCAAHPSPSPPSRKPSEPDAPWPPTAHGSS